MSGLGPANAITAPDGSRLYQWEDENGKVHELLSVTSIRRLLGTTPVLVEWGINNLLDTVLGTTKGEWRDYSKSKRGRKVEGRIVQQFPSDFAELYVASDGAQAKIDDVRRWLRETADAPKNIAGVRGTIVHRGIERNVAFDRVERPWVEATFGDLSQKDKAKAKLGVRDEDVRFVRAGMRAYWDMRGTVPFVIIAREPQVFNLSMGYAGSADCLIWFLGHFEDGKFVPLPNVDAIMRSLPAAQAITLKLIEKIGGTLAVGDWKTSKGVYTDQVVQTHAYGAGEFVGENGVIDHRLTAILQATTRGVLFHIRPNKWGVHMFPFTERVFNAFAGSVAFARFLAMHPKPYSLFTEEWTGALEAEEEVDTDE